MKKILRGTRGDVYIEFLICMLVFITVVSISLQIYSAIHLKLWLDNRTSAVMRNVQIHGEITADAESVLTEIRDKLGSDTTIEWDTVFIGNSKKIQLGESIRLRITGSVHLFKIGNTEGITLAISSESFGTGEVYWKSTLRIWQLPPRCAFDVSALRFTNS